ncbi:hypothetical protein A6S26_05885 [Nostoc sp. ATCC 43529]|nr:hypothetical protein A6S26_05885 [Nostoc sp. ATCC 43529]
MEPTISIPKGWQYPRFTFGQRTERGQIIGMKYYDEDTYLADEYSQGWRYILLADKNREDRRCAGYVLVYSVVLSQPTVDYYVAKIF